jgi:lysophospholipase L1-like esterase
MPRLFQRHRVTAVLSVVAAASLLLVGAASSAPSAVGFAETGGGQRWLGTWAAAMLPPGSTPVSAAGFNAWIRASGQFDAVIDFDAAVRDPASLAFSLPAYDGGDHLHFNVAGYQVLANSIDLSLFGSRAGARR